MDPETAAAADILSRSAEAPDAVLRYAAHPDGLVDVYLPSGPARPRSLVFFVHGGFWRAEIDRSHARPLAVDLARRGHVVALPEYRRVGAGGGWPTTATDVESALAALPDLLRGAGVAVTTTTLVGHSAGGQLVLWLANQPVGSTVRRVVALAPVGNLRKASEHDMGSGATVALLGGTPEQVPAVYDAADPATRMRTRPPCEIVVLHGDRDDAVPVQSSRGLLARFGWLDYRELPGVDHMALVDPLSTAWPHVLGAIGAP